MNEVWYEVDDFPGYRVGNTNEVWDDVFDKELRQYLTSNGAMSVSLRRDGKHHTRLVSTLVANAFLPDPEDDSFDAVIHLDGDHSNARPENLMWRPRRFANSYRKERGRAPFPDWSGRIELIETGEIFRSPRDCACVYGLLERDIYDSIMNGSETLPFGFTFRFMSKTRRI